MHSRGGHCQAFAEGKHHKMHTHGVWCDSSPDIPSPSGRGIKPLAHAVVSSCLVSLISTTK
jgi:hypothetical protein